MPNINLTGNEQPIPIEKAVVFRDFVIITKEIPTALKLMRDTCLEGKMLLADVNCAAYTDQVAHYIGEMLRTPEEGAREYVESLLRRMGPQEYAATQDIEVLWKRAPQEFPDLAQRRAGPEFLEEELVARYKENMAKLLGPRWAKVDAIKRRIEQKETGSISVAHKLAYSATPEIPHPAPPQQTVTSTKDSMRAELEEKMKRLKGQ